MKGNLTPTFEEELKKINQEIYERNVELAIRNRTFGILQNIYQIINTSLGVDETAQRVLEAMVRELKFQMGALLLVDRTKNELKTAAHAFASNPSPQINELFTKLSVSLGEKENYFVKTAAECKTHLTNSVEDLFFPARLTKDQTERMINETKIQTCIFYPILFAGSVMGVLVFGVDKHIGFLSKAEREILKELIGVIAIAIERAQIYADLDLANERLKEVDKLKDEFVSVASHELRTPMTAIKSYVWMTLAGKGGAITEKQKYYLERTYKSTDRLIKLVNDMLNISRIESGRMTFDMQCVDMKALTEEVIAEVGPRAEELGIKVSVTESVLGKVYADQDKIKEVFINLIGNSLKFTPQGGKIDIDFEIKDEKLITNVKDNGVGIAEEDKGMLFKKFGLVQGSYTTNQTAALGTGLGLYICKSILATHHGDIWCFSEGKGKGAIFSFSLPLCTKEQEKNTTLAATEEKEKVGIIHTAL